MANWPPQETSLTESEKSAYRWLLYQAMVDIRNLCLSRGAESRNPFEWQRQYRRSRVAGALAEWLHNPAHDMSMNFKGFNAAGFWRGYEGVQQRYSRHGFTVDYRLRYERRLAELNYTA